LPLVTIELAATITIIAGSALLFAYWFRYVCLLILSTDAARDHTVTVALANQLAFLEIQSQLRHAGADLERLRCLLDRDYAVLTSLLNYTSDCTPNQSKIEIRMLKINYRLLGLGHALSRRFWIAAARRTLEEMSLVVAHFANMIGKRAMSQG
jgi:hypothetical protein